MSDNDLHNSSGHAYMQVATAIAARIEAGEFTGRLPAERDIAAEYGVAYQTVRHAMAVLRERGLVITRSGRGIFAVPHLATAAGEASTSGARPGAARCSTPWSCRGRRLSRTYRPTTSRCPKSHLRD
jgi:GntR family transcriptional regulator